MPLDTRFIPAPERDSRRLLVVLHGLGDSVLGYTWMPEVLRLPWLNYLLVNAPDPYYGGYSWYDFAGDAATGVRRSRRLLDELLDTQRTAGFPTEQTGLFGFSQGCLMTLETGLRYPHRLAALVGVSGYVLNPVELLRELSPVAREQRVLVTHGRQDPVVMFANAKRQMEQLRAGGVPLTWREFDKPHTILEEELDVIRAFLEESFGTA
jgi:phospholipase/carboxylesterase